MFILSLTGLASAQSMSTGKSSNTKHVSSSHKAKKPAGKKSGTSKVETDNRKEYVKDGQLATPTGHDATPTNSDQYQAAKDSANKKKKKQ